MTDKKSSPIYSYLQFVMESHKDSPSQIAKDAGVSPTTITRFLNDPNYKFTPSMTTIQKIAKATGISPAPFLKSKDYLETTLIPYVSSELYDHTWGPGIQPDVDKFTTTLGIGYVEAGVWRDRSLPRIEDFLPLGIVNEYNKYKKRRLISFYVIVKGKSINKIASEGEVLFCSEYKAPYRALTEGELLILERSTDDGRLIELSARAIYKEGEEWILRHRSTEPEFEDEIRFSGSFKDVGVRVLGICRWVMRDYETGQRPMPGSDQIVP